MKAKLFCPVGKFGGLKNDVGAEFTIGRRGCDLNLDDGSISAKHARIFFDAASGTWMLEDLGSTNGTLLSGLPVQRPERLGKIETINFAGICDFLFFVVEGAGAASAPKAVPEEPARAVSAPDEGKTTYEFTPAPPSGQMPKPVVPDATRVEPPTPAKPDVTRVEPMTPQPFEKPSPDVTRIEPMTPEPFQRPVPPRPKDADSEGKTIFDPNFPRDPKKPHEDR